MRRWGVSVRALIPPVACFTASHVHFLPSAVSTAVPKDVAEAASAALGQRLSDLAAGPADKAAAKAVHSDIKALVAALLAHK